MKIYSRLTSGPVGGLCEEKRRWYRFLRKLRLEFIQSTNVRMKQWIFAVGGEEKRS